MTPKYVTDTIAALRQERVPLASRLDAIDLTIDNLSRVYGLHGTPQPLPLAERKPRLVAKGKREDASGEAVERRALLLKVIGDSQVGLTLSDLRKRTPKMDGKARSNALQILKADGAIRRAGNTWVKAAA
jgi:hypothetical protein